MSDLRPSDTNTDYGKAYDQLCHSYRVIDDFRMKLLGLLPLATSGIFLLADKSKIYIPQASWLDIGMFGFISTLGLLSYELHAIKNVVVSSTLAG